MPELPEVETIRRDLAACLTGKKIISCAVRKPKLVQAMAVDEFIKCLDGNSFTAIGRVGKLLIFQLKKGGYLLIHLKMTGQLIYQEPGQLIAGGHTLAKKEDNFSVPNKYTHVIWQFTGNRALYFNDLRQFGYLKIVDEAGLLAVKARFGVEPLASSFTGDKLAMLIARRPRSTIKAAILDQQLIAGIGNIYADEACHLAHILPDRRVATLTSTEIKGLAGEIKAVLRLSIKHRGTTFSDYLDAQGRKGNFVNLLRVYGRAGESCLTCKKGVIQKSKTAGRGTHFCPRCQK